jgi:hypothetical protein
MTTDPAVTRTITTFTKAADLECHVRLVTVENVRVLELRDFIPSLGEYGRGYWIPMTRDAVFSVLNGLNEVAQTEQLP